VIEWRKSNSKYEKSRYGTTEVEGNIAKVFIDSTQSPEESVDTFFHEMAHVFFGFHTKNKKMSDQQEEYLAAKIGHIAAALLK